MLRRSALAATLLLSACNKSVSYPDTAISVVMPDGKSPLTGRSLTHVRAYYQQAVDGFVPDYVESDITNGTFDLRVPIQTFSAPIEVRLEMSSASGVELVGGTPSYYPAEATSLALLVGARGTCATVTGSPLPTPRDGLGASLLGSYVVLAGGTDANGASAKLDATNLLTFDHYTLTDAAMPLGPTRMVPVDRVTALVVSEGRVPFLWKLYAADVASSRVDLTLHAGAQTADAVVAAPGYGAAVVGGGSDVSPSSELSWISGSTTVVTTIGLSGAYPDRAAAFAPNGVWIVSRASGDAVLEQVEPLATSATVRLAAIADGVRTGGRLVMSADGTEGLLLGGLDGTATPRTDTLHFQGCPAACVASAGPTWTNARTGFFVDPSGLLVGGTSGGAPVAIVEQVVFGTSGPTISAFATLATARGDAAAIRLPTGPVFVFGGMGPSGRLGSTEVCFPPL